MIAAIIYHLQCENFCRQEGSPWKRLLSSYTTYSVRISAARRGVLGRLRWVLCVEWAIIITIAVIIYHLQWEIFCRQEGGSLDVSGGSYQCVEGAIIITIAVIIYHLQCEHFCQEGSPWMSQVGPMCRIGNNSNEKH